MARQVALLGAAGRFRAVTVGGTGAGTVPSVPGGAINVKNAPYNATGNGTTDDGPAIRSAITAAGTNGTVYFPTGTYKFVPTGTITLPAGITLLGAGPANSVILYSPTVGYRPFAYAGGNNVIWHSLQIKRSTAQNLVMFPLEPFSGWTFNNCLLDGGWDLDSGATDSHCIQTGQSAVTNLSLLNSTWQNWVYPWFQDGAATGSTDGAVVRNCMFKNNHHTPLEINAPSAVMQNILVETSTFDSNLNPGSNVFAIGLANCLHVTVQRCLFVNHARQAINVEDRSSDVEIAYNRFIQNGTDRYSTIQIITDSSDIRVRHNVIDGTGTKGVDYIAAVAALGGGVSFTPASSDVPPSDVVISDNTIDRGSNLGIYHQCSGVTITNNRFNPSVGITNGGSTGTVTVSGSTVSTTYPADY